MLEEQILFSSYCDLDINNNKIIYQTGIDTLNSYFFEILEGVLSDYEKWQLYQPLDNEKGYVLEKISTNLAFFEQILPSNVHANLDEVLSNGSVTQCIDAIPQKAIEDATVLLHKQIANHLLHCEMQVSKGAISIRDGALIQATIITERGYFYVLIKNEFQDSIIRSSYERLETFPVSNNGKKKKPLKVAIYHFELDDENALVLDQVYLEDGLSSSPGPTWYEKFLALKKCTSDETNTAHCSKVLLSMWDTFDTLPANICIELRNTTLGYLTTHNRFDLDEYMEQIVTTHDLVPEHEARILEHINTLRSKPRQTFEAQFDIVKKAIKKQYYTKKIYPMRDSQDITISVVGQILKRDIQSYRSESGNYLMIRTTDEAILDSYPSHHHEV